VKDVMHHWLPDRHLGVAATLSHSDELIRQVADLLFDYQTQPGGVFGLAELPAGPFSWTVVERDAHAWIGLYEQQGWKRDECLSARRLLAGLDDAAWHRIVIRLRRPSRVAAWSGVFGVPAFGRRQGD
jgi:hypothetical protein